MPQGRPVVDAVHIHGAKQVDEGDVEEKIATTPSPKFLGLFRGVVYDYSVFNQGTLDTDLERIQRFYRARGFYDTKTRGGRVETPKPGHVDVTILLQEGPPVKTTRVDVVGIEHLPRRAVRAAKAATKPLALGEPFDEEIYEEVEAKIVKALANKGYAFAKVKRSAKVDLVTHTADVTYEVTPGVPAVLGPITIEGLGELPEPPVRRALALREGMPYSAEEIDEARTSVLDLGVFANVDIQPDLDAEQRAATEEQDGDPSTRPSPIVPLKVSVSPAKLRSVRLGGGVELDLIRTDVHLSVGWEHGNFLGGFRHLTLDFRPGLVFYPTRLPSLQTPTHYLPEEKSRAELAQPGFLEARTTGTLRLEYNIFPVLLSPKVDPAASVLGYRELKGSLSLDRTLWKLFGQVAYNIQRNSPFTYVGVLDPALSGVTISYVSLLTQLDYRNDKIHPHKGFFLSNDLQFAGGPFLGDARDIRTQPEARLYLPTSRRTTLALRGSVGFLFPQNYAQTLEQNAATGQQPAGTSRGSFVDDVQLVYFRAFFSGGPSSNRGYPLRGVGPHGSIPFFNPQLAALAIQNSCDPQSPDYNQARCAQPLGGLSLWELSAEFRFVIAGALSSALFCDGSDVSAKRVTIRPKYLHLSCGSGLRYDTPVGPIRLDVGYRVPGMQILGKPDSEVEGNPGTIFGAPIAVSLGIGEAF
jgi:outer membrane protein assembly factor BamA